MKNVLNAALLAATVLAGCVTEPGTGPADTSTTQEELLACLPSPSYDDIYVPPAKAWTGLPAETPSKAFVIIDGKGGGTWTAYAVDVANRQVVWTRTLSSSNLVSATDTMGLAGIGFWLRPPPLPRPGPPGSELLYSAEVGRAAVDAVDQHF